MIPSVGGVFDVSSVGEVVVVSSVGVVFDVSSVVALSDPEPPQLHCVSDKTIRIAKKNELRMAGFEWTR